MKEPPIPQNEKERLEALKEYQILDTLPEALYDDITKLASEICDTPISLISLVDDKRQWFKSHHGLSVSETEKRLAYCAHAINDPDNILEVPDAFEDERFHDNPLATGEPHVRFYAGAPLKDKQGNALGTLCVIDNKPRNLTKVQKECLKALSRQVIALLELRLETSRRNDAYEEFLELVENLGDGVFELDEDGNCIYANSKMLKLLNREWNEVVNTSIWDMIYHEDVKEMQRYYANQFRKKTAICYYEYRIAPKNGEPIWLAQTTTMSYHGKRMVRLRSISRDLSETKQLKLDLAEKDSLYRLVSENSSDLIAIHEPDGRYKFVAPSSKDLIGYKASELIGKNPYDFIHKEDIPRLQQGPHSATLDGEAVQKVEYRFRKKDGNYIWFESYTKPILNSEDQVISFQTSSRDITQKKIERQQLVAAKQKAEEATASQATFLSMMSHEIRTPLNGIIGITRLLTSKKHYDEQKTFLSILNQSSENLLALVNDILDYNKIHEGKVVLENINFSLHELIATIHHNYQLQAKEKDINCYCYYDENVSDYYVGDSTRISQILHNLLSNALKFTKVGHISIVIKKIATFDDYDELLFEVEDTGIGIDEIHHENIFKTFKQASSSTAREFGGSGLGLSITKSLIEMMGSQIRMKSQVNKGSIFHFNLKLKRSTIEINANGTIEKLESSPTLGAKILLVEDNFFNRIIAKDFLELWGCEVIEATNGEEALDLLQVDSQIDLVLLDLQMPVMDGFETIKNIRNNKKWAALPVIALTAEVIGDIEDKVLESGMSDYLNKPFHPNDFLQKLTKHLTAENGYDPPSTRDKIFKKLQQTIDGEQDVLLKYLNIFMKTAKAELNFLESAIETKAIDKIRAYGHKNKSSFSLAGLEELALESLEIENLVKDQVRDEVGLEKATMDKLNLAGALNELRQENE